jgi:hypothetical protein
MAYNVLKGAVEGSVDQYGDQEIEGIKVFKSTISASVFYDTDARSPCATENKVAFDKLIGGSKNSLLTYQGGKETKSHYNLTFDGATLKVPTVAAKSLVGSGDGLYNIPASKLQGTVPAQSINFGHGLEAQKETLKVNAADGIESTAEGVGVSLLTNGGLGFKNGKLVVNANNSANITTKGQNISDTDLLLAYDSTRGEVRHTTFKNLYDGFLHLKVPKPQGAMNSVQFKGNAGFKGERGFTYEPHNNTLAVKGTIKTLNACVTKKLETTGDLEINGALYKEIKVVADETYEFQDTDNTVLFDTTDHSIVATLPLAKENVGRLITIKKIHQNKYKLRSFVLSVKVDTGLIDMSNEITLKNNYSTRTFHSDGHNWWIINKSGI